MTKYNFWLFISNVNIKRSVEMKNELLFVFVELVECKHALLKSHNFRMSDKSIGCLNPLGWEIGESSSNLGQ